ncbi:matrixin family metalloprotease [Labrenzia sp. 011]|uniref:matrixin family metalloprotease n=1 Tax=Labrenzia sp. 011 TaxID=2171494 RepID=UPI00140246D1|nr:matrixin family metalloprotease [Labrenzia sp. 011]
MISFLLLAGLSLDLCNTARAVEVGRFSPLKLDGLLVKWGSGQLGTPAHVTYAFANGPLARKNSRNCRSMDSLDRLARLSGLSPAAIRKEAAAAFRLWEDASGVSFKEAASVGEADIVVGAQSLPRGYAFTSVQYAKPLPRRPDRTLGADRGLNRPGLETARKKGHAGAPDIAEITRSAVCLNPAHKWKIGFDGDLKSYDLRYTFAHEIGHAIGLDHYLRGRSIMHFKYRETFRALQPGDIAGARWLYGPDGS